MKITKVTISTSLTKIHFSKLSRLAPSKELNILSIRHWLMAEWNVAYDAYLAHGNSVRIFFLNV